MFLFLTKAGPFLIAKENYYMGCIEVVWKDDNSDSV